MSGSSNTPDIETLQQAGQEFAKGEISRSQLEQVQSGQKSLSEVRQSESGSEQSAESESESENDTEQSGGGGQSDTSASGGGSSAGSSGGGGSSSSSSSSSQSDASLEEKTEAGKAFARGEISESELKQIRDGETTLSAVTGGQQSSGGGTPDQPTGTLEDPDVVEGTETPGDPTGTPDSGDTEGRAIDDEGVFGADAPTQEEIEQAQDSDDFSESDVQELKDFAALDLNNDGVISDTDARLAADEGNFGQAQRIERTVDNIIGTEGDERIDALFPQGSGGQPGIDAPTQEEVQDASQEFASGSGDVTQDDIEELQSLAAADVNNDGVITQSDLAALADQGAADAAQALAESVPGVSPSDESVQPTTIEDVLGDDGTVSSADEADALAEAVVSSEISQEQVDELLDQAVDDEQGTVISRDTGVLAGQDFADQPGSAAFSRFDIAPPGGSTNPALGERTSVEDELILDRRGSAGTIESITINGQQVDISGRSVGPETERGGDASTDRLAIDLEQLGVDPGVADITIEERFGAQGELGTETTQIEALVTEDAPEVDNEAFEEQFQGTQTQDEVQNAVSGAEAAAILGEETVEALGGQTEAAAAVSGAIQGQPDSAPGADSQPSQQQSQQEQQEQQQPTPSGEAVIAEDGSLAATKNEVTQVGDEAQQQADTNVAGLAGNVGSVTDPNANTQPQSQSDAGVQTDTTQTAAEGEAVAAITSYGNQQLQAQQTQSTESADASTIVGADTALALAAKRQQRNRFEQEIDFTPGVEGDPIEGIVDDVTQSFAIGAEEAAEDTAQRQLDAVETLFGESQGPPSFAQRTVDDFFADTSETVAETPANLADAPEQIAGVIRDIGITAGVAEAGARGADREQDIDQAQSRNRQRLQSAVDQATETAENVAQNPSEIGGVAGAAGVALAGGAASAKAVNVVTRGRFAGGDLTYKVGSKVATKADDTAGRVESKAGDATSRLTDSIRDRTPPVSVDIDPDAPPVTVEDSVKQGARDAPSDLAGKIQSRIDALRDNRATKPNDDATADEVLRDLGDVDDTRQPAGPIQPPETQGGAADSGGGLNIDIEIGDNRASKPGGGVEQPDVIDEIGDVDDTRQPAGPERPPVTDPAPDADPNPLPSQPDRGTTEPQTGTTPDGDNPAAPPGMTDPMRDPDTDVPQRDARERYGESPTETGPNPNPLPSTPRRDSTRPTTITAPTDDASALPGLGASDALGRANLRAQLSESAQRGQPGVLGQSQLTASDAVFAARDRLTSVSTPSTPGVPTTTLRGSDGSLTDLTVRIGTPEQRRLVADDPTDDDLGPFPDDDLGGSLGRRFDTEDERDVETRTRDGSGQQSVFRIRSRRDDDGADVRTRMDDNRRGRRDRTPISDVGIAAGAASATESRFADLTVGTLTDATDTDAGVTTGADVTTAQTPLTTTDITPAVTPGVSQDAAADIDANLGSRVGGDVGARFDVGNRNRGDIDPDDRFDIDNRNRVDIDNRNRVDIDQRQDVDTDTPIRTDIDNTPERRFENRGMRDRERDVSEAVSSAFAGDEKQREYELRDLL